MSSSEAAYDYITATEAASLLGVKKATIYLMCERGELRGHKVRRKAVIYRSSVLEWIASHQFGKGDGNGKAKEPDHTPSDRQTKPRRKKS